MSTSITEEHRALWTKLYNLAHDEILEVASSDGPAHQLIADSEARAVAALTAERDQLRAELAEIHKSFAGNVNTENRQLRADLERADALYQRACEVEYELRAEVKRFKAALEDPQQLHAHCLRTLNEGQIAHLFGEGMTAIVNRAERAEASQTVALAQWNGALERAMKAEADLAEMHKSFAGNVHTENRVLQVELATERARLDYLGKCDGAFDHICWGDYRHYWGKGFGSLREIVDAAMKEDAK